MHALSWTLVTAALLASAPLHAQEAQGGVGLRLNLAAADGEPANDMPGAGMLAHYALNDAWTLGAAVDLSRFDFEEPAKLLGIVQDPNVEVVDALAESVAVRLWMERRLVGEAVAMNAFIAGGVGAAFLDVPDAAGPRADGGRFDIQTDADDEILVFVLGGVRRPLGARWYAEAGVTLEQHFAEWRLLDRVSGARASVDDYLSWGVYAAVGVRW